MPRKHPRDARPGAKPESGTSERFPDRADVKAFAEELLRKEQQGSYAPVESQRRESLAQFERGARRERVPEVPNTRPTDAPDLAAEAVTLAANSGRTLESLEYADEEDTGECLSDDTILAFVQGTLSGTQLVMTHRHLDVCPQCQRLIVEAVHAVSRRESATSDSQGSALRIGTVLGDRYRIQRFVARGGMGEVYEAYDRTLRERVALKTVMPTVSDSPRAVRRLMAEVQLARRVSHPNVCRIYDLGSEQPEDGAGGTLHFLTMEFVEGRSLAQELERTGPLPVEEAVEIARQLLSGLHAAHEAGILHRDFKPDNIMLRPSLGQRSRAVIMDFGLARAMDVDPARLTTGANQPLIGTLTYMAPEQVEGGDLTAGTDIFAFGIVFFEMLTGCVPFVGGSPAATALKRLKEAPAGPIEYAPHVSKHINRLVLKCLARHPSKRFASAAEVLRALDDEPTVVRSNADRGKKRYWPWVAATALLASGVGAWWKVPAASTATLPVVEQEPTAPTAESEVVVRAATAQPTPVSREAEAPPVPDNAMPVARSVAVRPSPSPAAGATAVVSRNVDPRRAALASSKSTSVRVARLSPPSNSAASDDGELLIPPAFGSAPQGEAARAKASAVGSAPPTSEPSPSERSSDSAP